MKIHTFKERLIMYGIKISVRLKFCKSRKRKNLTFQNLLLGPKYFAEFDLAKFADKRFLISILSVLS